MFFPIPHRAVKLEGIFCGQAVISSRGDITVEAVPIDDLIVRREIPPPRLVEIDIEGAEAAALKGAWERLGRWRPLICVGTHGPAVHNECLSLLSELSYEISNTARHDELIALPSP